MGTRRNTGSQPSGSKVWISVSASVVMLPVSWIAEWEKAERSDHVLYDHHPHTSRTHQTDDYWEQKLQRGALAPLSPLFSCPASKSRRAGSLRNREQILSSEYLFRQLPNARRTACSPR